MPSTPDTRKMSTALFYLIGGTIDFAVGYGVMWLQADPMMNPAHWGAFVAACGFAFRYILRDA